MNLPRRKINRFESSINVYSFLGGSLMKSTPETVDRSKEKRKGFMNSNYTLQEL
jgi:hypothetical protein